MLKLENGQAIGDPVPVGIKDHSTRDPSWSKNGWLAFYDETSAAFQFYYPTSGQRVSFANTTGEPGSWTADGVKYAAPDIKFPAVPANDTEYFSQLLLYDLQTGAVSELTRDNRMEDILPAFSPKGDQLVFARRFLNQENWTPGRQMWAINVDGTNPRPLTNSSMDNHLGFSWSPNGDFVAYLKFNTASLTGKRELWLMNMPTGSNQKILMEAYNLQWLP
jgi:Tol biopolymer transport system component